MSDWVLVVDDDASNLKMASRILGEANIRVSCLKSGEDALKFLQGNRPDIILLDIHMPGMNGFETIAEIRKNEKMAGIPVIFLTADEDSGTETKGLKAGAVDFIKKPFVPEVLLARIGHMIELMRLQTSLSKEVEKKTEEVRQQYERLEKVFEQVINALCGAIDAKDSYTKGHSLRVAEYSRKIVETVGFSAEIQKDVYIMGLLHDIGKIGISDSIINKPDQLTEEEYLMIKNHPTLGAGILENITEFPKLAVGAKWHHERYDGTGYPDGLSGEAIPMEARIIAIADAYDSMRSKRSYRDILPYHVARAEIERGKGTQFDPVFADAMIKIIDAIIEDEMEEKKVEL